MGKKALSKCTLVVCGQPKEVDKKTPNWLSNLGAKLEKTLSSRTTHLIASKQNWKDQAPLVEEARRLNSDEGKTIQIVSWAWAQDCCSSKKKKAERPYLWEFLNPGALVKRGSGVGSKGKEESETSGGQVRHPVVVDDDDEDNDLVALGGRKDGKGMMVEVFEESTKGFVDKREQKRIEKQIALEVKARREIEEEKEQREAMLQKHKDQTQMFARGAKRARNEIFSDNHHIFVDTTGFAFDITLAKVKTSTNTNERYVITIYESNSKPHTYAVNCQFFGASKTEPENKIICAMGCTYTAAFRAFKEVFREQTGGEWDLRINDHLDRQIAKNEEANARRAAGSAIIEADPEIPFEKMKFRYQPPKSGHCGQLSEQDAERVEADRERRRAALRDAKTQAAERDAEKKRVEEEERLRAEQDDLIQDVIDACDEGLDEGVGEFDLPMMSGGMGEMAFGGDHNQSNLVFDNAALMNQFGHLGYGQEHQFVPQAGRPEDSLQHGQGQSAYQDGEMPEFSGIDFELLDTGLTDLAPTWDSWDSQNLNLQNFGFGEGENGLAAPSLDADAADFSGVQHGSVNGGNGLFQDPTQLAIDPDTTFEQLYMPSNQPQQMQENSAIADQSMAGLGDSEKHVAPLPKFEQTPVTADSEISGDTKKTEEATNNAAQPSLNLGRSILGSKRKAPADESAQHTKKQQVDDSGAGSYALAGGKDDGEADDRTPRGAAGNDFADPGDQLHAELDLATEDVATRD